MFLTRRILACKWIGTLLAVLCLSQGFARWRDFFAAPGGRTYAALVLALSLFLALMAGLAVVVYAEAKALGQIRRPRPRLDRWASRLFGKPGNGED